MPPRTYYPNKAVAPLRPVSRSKPLQEIPLDAKLYSLRNASWLLNEQFDGGFSDQEIRRLIRNGSWQEKWHYVRRGTRIKIYIPAVQEWLLR